MLPGSNDDFLRMAGQQAMAHLFQNTFNNSVQQQQPQQQQHYNNSRPAGRGGWDRDGGHRRGFDQRERVPLIRSRMQSLLSCVLGPVCICVYACMRVCVPSDGMCMWCEWLHGVFACE